MQSVGIIGIGVIGSAVHKLFPNAFCYDPEQGYHQKQALNADFVFVCVPTPLRKSEFTGKQYLKCEIVEKVVADGGGGIFVICSTLQPGMADRLAKKYRKRIVVQPEYYGETAAHPLTELEKQPFLIFGGDNDDVNEVIDLYKRVYNANVKIRKVSRLEAEVIKLSENRAIAFKVAQCQELYDACEAAGIDYETIRQAVYGDDPRFNLWWTFVYENRGFNSKCIPKDVYGWKYWADSIGANTDITTMMLERNETLIGQNDETEKMG